MSTVNLDKENIRIYVLPGITETLNQINRVNMKNNYNSMPNDLPCRDKYLYFKDEMNQLYKDLSEVNNWLINSVKKYESFSNKTYDNVRLLPKSRVPVRTATLK